jgi:RNA polymerase sigma-70 factor (ECF subfamily)
VLIEAQLRLHRSLAEVQPPTVRDFLSFAALQIRRALLDLVRKHFGEEGPGGKHVSPPNGEVPASWLDRRQAAGGSPLSLDDWTEFHDRVERLPVQLREVIELLFYHGLTQEQAASLLEVSAKTVYRRWCEARALLCDME